MSQSEELHHKLEALEDKISKLVTAYIQLTEENYYLKKKLGFEKKKRLTLEEEIKNFQNQQKNSNIVSSSDERGDETVEQMKKQINKYVKMIDKCIDQLNA